MALSNGNSYPIKNGINGTNGIDGKDGLNGKDGKDGVDGKDGLNGKDGKDGLNGDYYVPNATTGKFDKYTYDAAQKKYVVLPTAPKEYSFKDNQLVKGVYNCYLLPDGEAESTKWNAANSASKGTMNMANVINFDDNYIYRYAVNFAETTGDKNKETLEVHPRDFKLEVAPSLIDNTTEHATTITYNYGGISTRKDNGKWETGKDYTPTSDAFKTIYCDVLAAPIMTWSASKLELKYEEANQTILLTKFTSENTYNATKLGGKTLTALKNCYVLESVELTSNGSKHADYFKAVFSADKTKIEFKPQSGTTNPTADVPSTLTIKAKDVFGQPVTISVAVTVKKQ